MPAFRARVWVLTRRRALLKLASRVSNLSKVARRGCFVRFEVYPVTGRSEDLEMAISVWVSSAKVKGGATISFRAAGLSLYAEIIWTKLSV